MVAVTRLGNMIKRGGVTGLSAGRHVRRQTNGRYAVVRPNREYGRPPRSRLAAVQSHDAQGQLEKITCPTLITFGRYDVVTSTRFADALTGGIKGAKLVVFEDCSHAPIYQNVAAFNERKLAFLQQNTRP